MLAVNASKRCRLEYPFLDFLVGKLHIPHDAQILEVRKAEAFAVFDFGTEIFISGIHVEEGVQISLICILKGIAYVGTDDDTLKSLRVIYVGASRPRYMLCVAIQKDRFDRIDCPELREIWDVKEV